MSENILTERSHVYVAGGSGGLGSAVCRRMARDGLHVLVGYNGNQSRADDVVAQIFREGGSAETSQIDLRDDASVAEVFSRYSRGTGERLQGIVYAAGAPNRTFNFFSRSASSEWSGVLEGDVLACIRFCREAIPYLRQSAGSIVATSTYQGGRLELQGSLSSIPKAAIERAMAVIAKEEGRYGVRANVVRAGWFDTGAAVTALLADEQTRQRKHRDIPLGRVGRGEEFANCVAFLLSEQASFVTGTVLTADGGESL